MLIHLSSVLFSGSKALDFGENFEYLAWDFYCGCNIVCGYTPCFSVLGCATDKPLVVRRVNGNNLCDYVGEVRQWTGGRIPYHGGGIVPDGGLWMALHLPISSNTIELMTSRYKQINSFGFLQADFYVHGPNLYRGSSEHYVVIHNLNLSEVPGCTKDCYSTPNSATNKGSSLPGKYQFYGVIAGGFGEPGIGYDRLGFVVEKASSVTDLIDQSFIPYYCRSNGVCGNYSGQPDQLGDYFPAHFWFRVKIERQFLPYKGDTYSYWIYRWNGFAWHEVGHSQIHSGLLSDEGQMLPGGYVGIAGAFFDLSRHGSVYLGWDNVLVNW